MSIGKPARRAMVAGILLIGSLTAGGCLVGSSSNIERRGTYVADTTLRQIKPGETTEAWVLATLGPPTATDPVGENKSLWKYAYTEEKRSSGHVFLLFHGSSNKETDRTVFVEFEDGIVTRTWRG